MLMRDILSAGAVAALAIGQVAAEIIYAGVNSGTPRFLATPKLILTSEQREASSRSRLYRAPLESTTSSSMRRLLTSS
jgi:hypothetical protein